MNFVKTISGKRTCLIAGALLPALVLGCSHDKKKEARHDDFFPQEGSVRQVDKFLEIQAAEGAKEDAMLFASHFDGEELNTSGQTKLHLMMRDRSPRQPLVVYMNLGVEDKLAKARRSAVEQYLKYSGATMARVEFQDGDNPYMRSTAATGLRNLRKTDSDYEHGGGGSEMTPSPAASSVDHTR